MMELAQVHFRQGRAFLHAGDSRRAVELLEKARILARSDKRLLAMILEDLSSAYDDTGHQESAALCRDQLDRLLAALPVSSSQSMGMMDELSHAASTHILPLRSRSRIPWLVTSLVLIALFTAGTGFWWFRWGTALTAPDTVSQAQLLKETVALIVVVLSYHGMIDGRETRIDIPVGTGSGFVINRNGNILTNHHVIDAEVSFRCPEKIHMDDGTLFTKSALSYIVCFGPDPKDHLPATVVHDSTHFDMAVLKIDRTGGRFLSIAAADPQQGEEVRVCGFPGVVQDVLDSKMVTQDRMPVYLNELLGKWMQSRHYDLLDAMSPDSFYSTLTRGIVSAAKRNIEGAAYFQTDATISHGNSGGPVLNLRNEVVGVATLKIEKDGNHGFALLFGQLRYELDPFLKAN